MNYLDKLKHNWEKFAISDPYWAILTEDSKKNNNWDIKEFFKTGEAEIKNLIAKLNENEIFFQNGLAIDFGCGVGRLTQALAKYFKKVYGLDISHQMIGKANELNKKENTFYSMVATPNFTKINDSHVDFIYSNITLQHIRPKVVFNYLGEFNRVLKKGGLLVFQLPDSFNNKILAHFRENIFLYNLYLNFKFYNRAKMETYSIRKEDIISFMENNSFELKYLEENKNAGPKWRSYTYYFKKKNENT